MKCPRAKSSNHCLTELFSIYQNKHWTIKRRDNHIVVSSSNHIKLKIDWILADLELVFLELRLTITFIRNMYECLKYEFQVVFKINHINFKQNQTFWISITFERFSINPPMWSPYGHSFPYTMHKSNFLNILEQTPTLEFIKFWLFMQQWL